MSDKTLQLKTPLKNMLLNLRSDRMSGTELVNASLGRYTSRYDFRNIVFTFSDIQRCRLHVRGSDDCSLWIGSTAFDVRPEDVDLIATTFGIRIDKKDEGESA